MAPQSEASLRIAVATDLDATLETSSHSLPIGNVLAYLFQNVSVVTGKLTLLNFP